MFFGKFSPEGPSETRTVIKLVPVHFVIHNNHYTVRGPSDPFRGISVEYYNIPIMRGHFVSPSGGSGHIMYDTLY
jgi:hypothetical protein